MGVIYAIFIILCSIRYLRKFLFEEKIVSDKKLFYYIVVFFSVFYFAISLWFNYANQPTGDEPEYILMAHSIVFDGDLDLSNNFKNLDYKKFYKDKILLPQDAAIKKNGKLYSYHPFFISLISSPFYFIGGRLGATTFLNIIAALLIGILYLIFIKIYNDNKLSLLLSCITGLSMPILTHINHIATDITSGLILTFAVYVLMFLPHRYILFSVLIILGVWLHLRNIPVAFIMLMLFFYKNRKNMKIILITFVLQIINIILFFYVNKVVCGTIIPSQGMENTAGSFMGGFHLDMVKAAIAFTGLFFDQEFGLFFYTPMFIFIFVGYYFLYRFKKDIFYNLILIFIPFIIFISIWGEWRGGGGASSRFFVPVIFLLMIPVSIVFYFCKDKISRFVLFFMVFYGFIMSFFMVLIPWFRWNKGFGENWMLKILSQFVNLDLTNLFPSLWNFKEQKIAILIFWVLFVFAINLRVFIKCKNKLTNR